MCMEKTTMEDTQKLLLMMVLTFTSELQQTKTMMMTTMKKNVVPRKSRLIILGIAHAPKASLAILVKETAIQMLTARRV